MTGSGSGPLGLLLMIAPLAAIPVFAIVGVPQFAPLSASQGDDEDAIEWREAVGRSDSASSESIPKTRNSDDLFAPVTYPSLRTDAAGRRSNSASSSEMTSDQIGNSGRWLPPPEALDQWEVRPESSAGPGSQRARSKPPSSATARSDRVKGTGAPAEADAETNDDGLVSAEGFDPDLLKPDKTAKPKRNVRPAEETPVERGSIKRSKPEQKRGIEPPPELEDGSVPPGQALAEQAGWQSAARRLKELGIRKYRLESQIEEQTFVFVCTFAAPDNPRVIRRFEADADTPLEAVQSVLQQIDAWRSRDGRGDEAESPADDDR